MAARAAVLVKAVIGNFLVERGVDWGRCRVFVDEVKVAGSVYSLDRVDPLYEDLENVDHERDPRHREIGHRLISRTPCFRSALGQKRPLSVCQATSGLCR
jgi:hypothetical protein